MSDFMKQGHTVNTVSTDLETSMKTQNILIRKIFVKWTQQNKLTA